MGYIYKIINTVNGKSYIGKTIHEPVKGRIRRHLYGTEHNCRALHHAVKKYGRNAFSYEILHEGIAPELLDSFEIEAIKKHNTIAPNGYNLTYGGEGNIPSKETREKLSLAHRGKKLSPEARKKVSLARRGKKLSKEHRKKLSIARRRRVTSKETREKLSLAQRGKKHTPEARRKMSIVMRGKNRSPHWKLARDFYHDFDASMDISEKRHLLKLKFSDLVHEKTINKWIREWNSQSSI